MAGERYATSTTGSVAPSLVVVVIARHLAPERPAALASASWSQVARPPSYRSCACPRCPRPSRRGE
eukprot:6149500-Prymnesium_polylepis.1